MVLQNLSLHSDDSANVSKTRLHWLIKRMRKVLFMNKDCWQIIRTFKSDLVNNM